MMFEREETLSVHYKLKGESRKQDAIIYFVNGEFTECTYHVDNIKYTLSDWGFLGKLAVFILKQEALERQRYQEMKRSEPAST